MSIDLDFEKFHQLVPAVLQDADSHQVLMLGFMDREALGVTLRTGRATFLSRSRGTLWTKGETSGNYAQVVEILTDCDRDTLLLKVRVGGDGVICHTGAATCFVEPLEMPAPDAAAVSS